MVRSVRLAAAVAVFGGILWSILLSLTLLRVSFPYWVPAGEAIVVALAIVILHQVQGGSSGFSGWAGIRLAVVGLIILAIAVILGGTHESFVGSLVGVGLFTVWCGVLLFWFGVFVAGVVSQFAAMVLIIGWMLIYAHNLIGVSQLLLAPFGLGLVLVGIDLTRRESAQGRRRLSDAKM